MPRPGRLPPGPGRPGELAAAPGASTQARRDLGTRSTASAACWRTRQAPEAADEYRTALAIRQKLADDNPAVSEFRNALAASHNNLGIVLWQTGRPKEAEAEYRTALAIREKLADDNPAVSEFRNQLGQPLQPRPPAPADGPAEGGRGPRSARRWRSSGSWPTANPAVTEFRSCLALNHHYLGPVL